MKPLGAAGMQAVINPAQGFINIARRSRLVSLCRSQNTSLARNPQSSCSEPSRPITRNGEREQCT